MSFIQSFGLKTAAGGGPPPFGSTYLNSLRDLGNAATYTFAGESLGTADSTRLIVVAIYGLRAAGIATLNGVTIAGVTATKLVGAEYNTGAYTGVSMWAAAVPTGTTGSIVASWNTTIDQCAFTSWNVIGADIVPFDTASDVDLGAAVSMLIDNAASGIVLCATTLRRGTGTATITWTGATRRHTAGFNTATRAYSSASDDYTSAATNRAIDPFLSAYSGSERQVVCAVSLEPL